MNTPCPTEQLLQRFLREELSEDEDRAIDTHVEGCRDCQQTVERLVPALRSQASKLRRLVQPSILPATVVPPDSPAAPPQIPGYEILGVLGQGGMGITYKARHLTLNRIVALKMILSGAQARPEQRERFRREAEMVARIRHPNVVQIHDLGHHDGQSFLAMEWIDGPNLDQHLATTTPTPRWSAEIVEKIARAVDHVHQQGVIHRDLKPGNVMLAGAIEPKVLDFGLARPTTPGHTLTESGVGLGTPPYMAPEQVTGNPEQIGVATDVYGIGAILYHLLTGQPPFQGKSPHETVHQVLTCEPISPRRSVPTLARDLETICLKCLQKEPRQRYASAAELADDVRRFLDGRSVLARPVGFVERARKWYRRNRAVAGLLVTVVAMLLIGAGVAYYLVNWTSQQTVDKETLAGLQAWDAARRLCEVGEVPSGLDALATVLRTSPGSDQDLQESLRRELLSWSRLVPTPPLSKHPRAVLALAVSPEGDTFFTGCQDGIVRIWDRKNPRESEELGKHQAEVLALAYCEKGGLLLTGSADGTARLWDARTRKLLCTLDHRRQAVQAVALSRDGQLALTGCADRKARLWNVAKGELLRKTVAHPGPVATVAFSPDGKRFVTGSDPGKDQQGPVWLWDTNTDLSIFNFTSPERRIRAATFSHDGKRILTGDDDNGVGLFDVDRKEKITWWYAGSPVRSVAFAPDDRTALTGSEASGEVLLWDIDEAMRRWNRTRTAERGGPPRGTLWKHPAAVTGTAILRDGSYLTACEDGNVRIWPTPLGDPPPVFLPHNPGAKKHRLWVAFHPKGELVATGGEDGQVRFWNVQTGEETGKGPTYQGPIKDLAFTEDGLGLLIGWKDGLDFWDRDAQRVTRSTPRSRTDVPFLIDSTAENVASKRLDILPGQENAVAFHKKTGRIFTGDDDGTLSLWDAETGSLLLRYSQKHSEVLSARFSPDGAHVVTCGEKNTFLWEATTGVLLARFSHPDTAHDAAFTPDGRWLLTVGDRGTGAQLWNIRHRKPVGQAYKPAYGILSVALSPDGKTAVLGGLDGMGILWSLPQP